MEFNSYYGAGVRLSADLVNAVVGGEVGGRPFFAPRRPRLASVVLEVLRSVDPQLDEVGDQQAEAIAVFAERLRTVFSAMADKDVARAAREVNALLGETRAQPELVLHGDDPCWHVHFRGTAGGLAAEWTGACAAALAAVVGSSAGERLGVCTASRCDRVYVDTSHNARRRFCSLTCQNRVKTAAFRARRAGDS
ncbi:CGNR zinc finger domain-containing protein [Allokutzneria albata]|uniref:Conserved protein containing a Zn-ribbon-like motif, possibly RNA-binding n=1 Tax=Allokutzneria albata TaxID=211114 RepID=A0A1G9SEE8_ALLAB|nr:CGNR zinc finger domain-containing protein [Allokutzneria albata]SDM33848.1 Conserved protein containing a Zn-ribbon-like motif, possibly RNA-binding [Allokutzneria albata]